MGNKVEIEFVGVRAYYKMKKARGIKRSLREGVDRAKGKNESGLRDSEREEGGRKRTKQEGSSKREVKRESEWMAKAAG